MRRRSWLFLSLGVLLSVLTGVALNGVAQQSAGQAAAAPADTVSIVVAKVDVPGRTIITGAMLAHREDPKDLLPSGAISNDADAIGQTTLAAIPNGAALLRAQLVSADGKTGSSITVESGKVLVSFPTSDPLTIGGVVPGGDPRAVPAAVPDRPSR